MGTPRNTFLVLALMSGCAGDDSQGSAHDASARPVMVGPNAGEAGRESQVGGRTDGGGFKIPAIELSELDVNAISKLEGVYYVKTVNGYLIACWEDGRVQVRTPRGETCSKNVGVTGRSTNVHVQSRDSPDQAVVTIHGVELVRGGVCVP